MSDTLSFRQKRSTHEVVLKNIENYEIELRSNFCFIK